ncbi:glutamate racemase [Pollutibacter soli]|uniref:glutamate racemase n=1 Tax=Pollutibacter soli TaxID=3034157 RepID=UPI0030139CEA
MTETRSGGPIGIFDSGYGGLTVMKEIVSVLPEYDYIYLGDNARAPYGPRSFDTVYHYTLECVRWFFEQGCPLVILACNTASAKALRTIQQNDLPNIAPDKRVLGVIRPTAEIIGEYTHSKKIGVLGTRGTVQSDSYLIEINKFFPHVNVFQQACPMWVPIVENQEYDQPGADYFVKKSIGELLQKSDEIDTILLACTHYPLLLPKIIENVPEGMRVIPQGEIVARSLQDYLRRHQEMNKRLNFTTIEGKRSFFTTDSPEDFDRQASVFFGEKVISKHVEVQHF